MFNSDALMNKDIRIFDGTKLWGRTSNRDRRYEDRRIALTMFHRAELWCAITGHAQFMSKYAWKGALLIVLLEEFSEIFSWIVTFEVDFHSIFQSASFLTKTLHRPFRAIRTCRDRDSERPVLDMTICSSWQNDTQRNFVWTTMYIISL